MRDPAHDVLPDTPRSRPRRGLTSRSAAGELAPADAHTRLRSARWSSRGLAPGSATFGWRAPRGSPRRGAGDPTKQQRRDTAARASPAVTEPPCGRLCTDPGTARLTAYGLLAGLLAYAAASTVARFAATFAALRPTRLRLRLRRDRRTAPSPDRLDAHLSGRCGRAVQIRWPVSCGRGLYPL
jgi:hypothetical protein